MLVLRVLQTGPMHGYAIAQRIHQISSDVLQVEEGSLYPALYRMENKGWVTADWGITENNRRAKYYRLTAAGRRQLAQSTSTWQTFSDAMNKIMSAAPQSA